jgi:A/G-specific adenine glycosylase
VITQRRIVEFQQFIFSWWKTHRRDLPWRHTHDPYKILISEVMLQQTNVFRVIPKYAEFIEAYPTVNSLAKASTADVLRLWKGMGYNRRAVYLKKAAMVGKIPKTEKELMKLPGVGKYTARAILVFAYREDIAAVDTNIRKIITHFFFQDKPQKEKIIQKAADQLVPGGKSWEWHQALMDYGALEMPKFNSKKIKKKAGIPFKQSNRYFRGKIIDVLREGPVDEHILLKDYSARLLNGLMKDGLIEEKNGIISLPD